MASRPPPPHYRCAARKDQKRTQQHFGLSNSPPRGGLLFVQNDGALRIKPSFSIRAHAYLQILKAIYSDQLDTSFWRDQAAALGWTWAADVLEGRGHACKLRLGMPSVHGLPLYHEIHGATNGRVPAGAVARRWGHDWDLLRSCAAGARARPAGDRLRATGLRAHSNIADRPFSFVDSADDAAALLKHCIGQADLFGSARAGRLPCR
jgi:hypothetical protein